MMTTQTAVLRCHSPCLRSGEARLPHVWQVGKNMRGARADTVAHLRRVRQVGDLVLADLVFLAADVLAPRHHAAPDLRQGRQDGAVAVHFRRRGSLGAAF